MKPKIILASKSPYRKQLLARLGIEFECMPSSFDEAPLKQLIADPKELTAKLALEKANIVAQSHPDTLVIGSDQVAHLEGEILGKTGSYDGSVQQLLKLSGKTHELITSYIILYQGKIVGYTDITQLKMRKLSEEQIKKYLTHDNPIDCAGSYKLELSGISLFEEIKTKDHTAIVGLPLIQLANDLIALGQEIPPR